MIRSQIPKFRLPETVIDEEVGYILDLGIEFRGGTRIDSPAGIARAKATTRSSSAAARRAVATSICPAARKRRRTSTSASTGCRAFPSATSTRSASA